MAGRYKGRTTQDMSSFYTNIDSMLSALVEVQADAGVEPSVELAVYDDNKRKFKRFQRRTPEEEEVYQRKKREMLLERSKENRALDEIKIDEDEDGVPMMTALRDYRLGYDGDDDGIYICEYCSKLGYRQKYDPAICDNCTECLDNCNEFANGECSGCSYSRHREGRPYSDFLTKEQMIDEDTLRVFDIVKEEDEEASNQITKEYDSHFSVYDY